MVIHCYEFNKMMAFWQEALHYVPRELATDARVVLCDPKGKGPNVSLDRVPDWRSGKRNRLHLDPYTTDQKGDVERLIKLGRDGIRGSTSPKITSSSCKIPMATTSA
jgi:Glyoxalase-like domain